MTRTLLVGALLAALSGAVPAIANHDEKCQIGALAQRFPSERINNPRVSLHSLMYRGKEYPFDVQLPKGYGETGNVRRYPVFYLLHGYGDHENEWFYRGPAATEFFGWKPTPGEFFDTQPPERRAIIVALGAGYPAIWSDWRDGSRYWETFHTRVLVPWIDAHYRTLADRTHRVVAGYSMGGFGAMAYAARHPDLFSVAGSFSGAVDLFALGADAWLFYPVVNKSGLACQHSDPAGPDAWGDPVTDEIWWRTHNPVDLAANMRDVVSYISSGNGVSCKAEEAPYAAGTFAQIEPLIRVMTKRMDRALSAAGASHRTDLKDCGIHWYLEWMKDIPAFWDLAFRAMASPSPQAASFDYRLADPRFTVWGWTFVADRGRAAEFLEVRDASAAGITLIGSGTETVTTAALFAPGQHVTLTGATSASAVTDAAGRITFRVDLGPAHHVQQYTPGARRQVFATRTVQFDPSH